MSEPKRGVHCKNCLESCPSCKCNTCRNDTDETACCIKTYKFGCCYIKRCKKYIKDEPTKKGAEK